MATWVDLEPGRFATPVDFNDADNNEPSATVFPTSSIADTLGSLRWQIDATGVEGTRCLKLVQVDASTAATLANGDALAFSDAYGLVVTNDVSDASQNQPAGVAIGAGTASSYCWIQVKGYHSAIKTSGGDNIADGDNLILSSTDKTVERVAAGTAPTYKIIGIAVADDVDADNTVAGQIFCL